MMQNLFSDSENFCMDNEHEGDSSTRLMLEQLQVMHRRQEAETIVGLIRQAQTLEAVQTIVKQRLDSLIISEDSLAAPTPEISRTVQ